MDSDKGSIILDLERKLNPKRFFRRGKRDNLCKISLNYYWDLLKYVDDDYLSEWEILKFKDLYANQLGNMIWQTLSCFGLGYVATSIIMSPTIISPTNGYLLRLPMLAVLTSFLCVQSPHWMRPNQEFHEIMWQPNPHGSYVRKVVRFHFPKLWEDVSANLHENGYNLKEMNEYDNQVEMPELSEKFDTTRI